MCFVLSLALNCSQVWTTRVGWSNVKPVKFTPALAETKAGGNGDGNGDGDGDGDGRFGTGEVRGCIAVVDRCGGSSFVHTVRQAQRAGAVGVVVVNYRYQEGGGHAHPLCEMTDTKGAAPPDGFDIPAIAVSHGRYWCLHVGC